jgi:hypothetical protein
LGAAPVAGYEAKNFARLATTVGNDFCRLEQKIESVRTFAGQTATISFWAKGTNPTTAGNLAITLQQFFGTGGSPSAQNLLTQQTFVLTANWTRYSFTFAVPSISGKTLGTNGDDCLGVWIGQGTSTSADAWTLDLWGVQAEYGSYATPFQTATGTIQGELAACQRYYYRVNGGSNLRFGSGQAIGTTLANCLIPFPVQMRTAPTALEQSGTASQYGVLNASASSVLTGGVVPTFDKAGLVNANVTFTVTSGLVAGNAAQCMDNNSSSAYLGWSAEL